jgi:hypothetical protein
MSVMSVLWPRTPPATTTSSNPSSLFTSQIVAQSSCRGIASIQYYCRKSNSCPNWQQIIVHLPELPGNVEPSPLAKRAGSVCYLLYFRIIKAYSL